MERESSSSPMQHHLCLTPKEPAVRRGGSRNRSDLYLWLQDCWLLVVCGALWSSPPRPGPCWGKQACFHMVAPNWLGLQETGDTGTTCSGHVLILLQFGALLLRVPCSPVNLWVCSFGLQGCQHPCLGQSSSARALARAELTALLMVGVVESRGANISILLYPLFPLKCINSLLVLRNKPL